MIGYGAIVLCLVLSLAAAFLYSRQHATRLKTSRWAADCCRGAAVMAGIAVLYLLYLLLSNNFAYAYVFGYSGRSLPLAYKLSALWAGQEGSFLVWLGVQTLFGVMILRSAPPAVMAVYSLWQAALSGLLIVKSPFMMLAETRLEGAGLNPLLQDPWMVIHPPLVFIGYAALAVPLAYVLGALLAKEEEGWQRALAAAVSWLWLAVASLGAGMFIGGYWAYKVLGWGGYWAWDPVENSSLVPWLAACAAVHLAVLATKRPAALRYAYGVIIVSFLLVLYGTFLTRSGVLSDFSTHSFADEGIGSWLGILLLVVAAGAGMLYIARLPLLPAGELYERAVSKEFMAALAALMLGFLGVLVFIGMSTPLVSLAFGKAQSVTASFYNNASLPLAAALSGALAAAVLVKWGGKAEKNMGSYAALALGAAAGLVIVWSVRLPSAVMAASVVLAAAAAIGQLQLWRSRALSGAAALSHAGIALMIAGIMTSGGGSQTMTVQLAAGQAQTVWADQLTYSGMNMAKDNTAVYTVFTVNSAVEKTEAVTKLNAAGQAAAREPGIYRNWLYDLYIAPQSQDEEEVPELVLSKGEMVSQGEATLQFVKFNMSGMDGNGPVRVEAIINFTYNGATTEVRPEITSKNGVVSGSTVQVGSRYALHIIGIKPGEGKVFVELHDHEQVAPAGERLAAEVSRKPLINLLWLGALAVTAASLAAAQNAAGRNVIQEKRGHVQEKGLKIKAAQIKS